MEQAYCIISCGTTLLTLSLLLLCNSKQTNKQTALLPALCKSAHEYFDQWEESTAVHSSLGLSDLTVT
jgi:hypothetical protein